MLSVATKPSLTHMPLAKGVSTVSPVADSGMSQPRGAGARAAVAAAAVRAASRIPAAAVFGPYISHVPIGISVEDVPASPGSYVQVRVVNGRLVANAEQESPYLWLSALRAARDRHEQNVEAFRDGRGLVFFRTVKEIDDKDELLVWYSDELARECGIPALTPANIRGDQRYMCTSCNVCHRFPNTLKAHIRFHCRKNSITAHAQTPLCSTSLSDYLLRMSPMYAGSVLPPRSLINPSVLSVGTSFPSRLHSAFTPPAKSRDARPRFESGQDYARIRCSPSDGEDATRGRTKKEPHNSKHSLLPVQQPHPIGYPLYPNSLPCTYPYPGLYSRGYSCYPILSPIHTDRAVHHSAFQSVEQGKNGGTMDALNLSQKHKACPEDAHGHGGESDVRIPTTLLNFPMPSEKAGEPIDLLPRSLYTNKSYKGHLCIYCGKWYSRKYGLKIHLRTHTGYKPLKCKVCLRPFGDPSNLNKHIRLHAEGETPYRCDYCGKVLVRRRDLERHIKSRHPNEHPSGDATCVDLKGSDDDELADVDDADDVDARLDDVDSDENQLDDEEIEVVS